MLIYLLVAVGVIAGEPQAGVVGSFDSAVECKKALAEVDKQVKENINKGMPVQGYILECKGINLKK